MRSGRVPLLALSSITWLPTANGAESLQSRVEVKAASNQIPSVEKFIHRAYVSLAVLGDYLYIDGGEIASLGGDVNRSTVANVTLSVPLNKDWTSDTVEFNAISKGEVPYLSQQAFMINENATTFYAWGGEASQQNTSQTNNRKLWAFTGSDTGDGTWEIQRPANPSVFNTFWRSTAAANAVCGNVGYYLNGYATYLSDSHVNGLDVAVPGLLTYDMTTSTWANESTLDALGYVVWSGTGTCIPHAGSKGAVIFLGGQKSLPHASAMEWDWVYMSNITMYDPETKTWLWQETTGDTPPPRYNFCSVGVPGTNGTFEIYVFGGASKTSEYGDLWILSLPAFHWIKVDLNTSGRYVHACALVGERQMISVGGLQQGEWTEPDQWSQGIGVLDLPTLTWSDGYKSKAGAYDTPQIVKDYYKTRDATKWSSKEVEALFASNSPDTDNPSESSKGSSDGSPSEASSNGSSNQSSNRTSSESSNKASNASAPVGAIVAGVVGVIALVATIFGVLFFLRRGKQRQQAAPNQPPPPPLSQPSDDDWCKAELPDDYKQNMYPYMTNWAELPESHGRSELVVDQSTQLKRPRPPSYKHASRPVYEMPADDWI